MEYKGVYTFPLGISPKVNVIAWLELELSDYVFVIQDVSHYATGSHPRDCIRSERSIKYATRFSHQKLFGSNKENIFFVSNRLSQTARKGEKGGWQLNSHRSLLYQWWLIVGLFTPFSLWCSRSWWKSTMDAIHGVSFLFVVGTDSLPIFKPFFILRSCECLSPHTPVTKREKVSELGSPSFTEHPSPIFVSDERHRLTSPRHHFDGELGNWWIISCYTLPTGRDVELCKFFFLLAAGFGLVNRVFANGPVDLGSIPGRVIPKTLKMVLDTSLLNTQQYKIRIESKVEQSRERSSALPSTSV